MCLFFLLLTVCHVSGEAVSIGLEWFSWSRIVAPTPGEIEGFSVLVGLELGWLFTSIELVPVENSAVAAGVAWDPPAPGSVV